MRDENGRWKPGHSGNPGGRPKKGAPGIRELRSSAPEVVAKLIEKAKGGDVPAMKLVLERVLPTLKPQTEPVEIEIREGETHAEAILRAAVEGEITPDQAGQLVAIAEKAVRTREEEERQERYRNSPFREIDDLLLGRGGGGE